MGIRITPQEDNPTPIPGNSRLACWCYEVSYVPVGDEDPDFSFSGNVRSGIALDFPSDVTVEEPAPYRDVCPEAMNSRSLVTARPARRWIYPGVELDSVTEFTICFVANSAARGRPFPISVHQYRFVREGDRTIFRFSKPYPVERGTLPIPERASLITPESENLIALLAKYEATKLAFLASQLTFAPTFIESGLEGMSLFPGEIDETLRVDFQE